MRKRRRMGSGGASQQSQPAATAEPTAAAAAAADAASYVAPTVAAAAAATGGSAARADSHVTRSSSLAQRSHRHQPPQPAAAAAAPADLGDDLYNFSQSQSLAASQSADGGGHSAASGGGGSRRAPRGVTAFSLLQSRQVEARPPHARPTRLSSSSSAAAAGAPPPRRRAEGGGAASSDEGYDAALEAYLQQEEQPLSQAAASRAAGGGTGGGTGFVSARGKAVAPSAAALARARTLFGDDSEETAAALASSSSATAAAVFGGEGSGDAGGFSGFSTGRGKTVAASAAALARARALLGDDSDAPGPAAPSPPVDGAAFVAAASSSAASGSAGSLFSTGRGKAVTVSTAALALAKSLLGDDDGAAGAVAASAAELPLTAMPSAAAGSGASGLSFSTGRGKAVAVSAAALARAKSLLGDDDGAVAAAAPAAVAPLGPAAAAAAADGSGAAAASGGFTFSTGRGKAVSVSDAALARAKSLLGDADAGGVAAPVAPAPPAATSSSGGGGFTFTTGKGATVGVSAAALQRGKSFLAGDDGGADLVAAPAPTAAAGAGGFTFATGKGGAVAVSAAAMAKARALMGDDATVAPSAAAAGGAAAAQSVAGSSSSATSLQSRRSSLGGAAGGARKSPFGSGGGGATPGGGAGGGRTPGSASRRSPGPSLPFKPPRMTRPKVGFAPVTAAADTGTGAGTGGRGAAAAPRALPQVFELTPDNEGQPRLPLRQAYETGYQPGPYPVRFLPSPPDAPAGDLAGFAATADSLLAVTSLNALAVVFDAGGQPRLPLSALADPAAPAAPSAASLAGATRAPYGIGAAQEALLVRGCDRAAVSLAWVANHWRWVVWKLATAEARGAALAAATGSTTAAFAGYCTFDRVLGQLLYRYERERRAGHRSALRRVLEGDAPPAQHIVLAVAAIETVGGAFCADAPPQATAATAAAAAPQQQGQQLLPPALRVELTDGWYSVGGLPADGHVRALIASGRLAVGHKVRVACAELMTAAAGGSGGKPAPSSLPPSPFTAGFGAADPAEPLDCWHCSGARWGLRAAALPPAAAAGAGAKSSAAADDDSPPAPRYLTLHYNSVRPVEWDARLGFQRSITFAVSLRGLVPGGGVAPCLQVVLARRHPGKFLVTLPGPAGGVGQRQTLDAVEAGVLLDQVRRKRQAELEAATRALQREHMAKLGEIERRLSGGGGTRAGAAPRSSSAFDGDLSPAMLSLLPDPHGEIAEAQEEYQYAVRKLHERFASLEQGGPNRGGEGGDDGGGDAGGAPVSATAGFRAVPFCTLRLLDLSVIQPPASGSRGDASLARLSPASDGSGGSGTSSASSAAPLPPPQSLPPLGNPSSCAITLWRVPEEAQQLLEEGRLYRIVNAGVNDSPAPRAETGAFPPPVPGVFGPVALPVRLTTSNGTSWQPLGPKFAPEPVLEALLAPGTAAAAASDGAGAGGVPLPSPGPGASSSSAAAPPTTPGAPLTPAQQRLQRLCALRAVAAGFVPRQRWLIAHLDAAGISSLQLSARAQLLYWAMAASGTISGRLPLADGAAAVPSSAAAAATLRALPARTPRNRVKAGSRQPATTTAALLPSPEAGGTAPAAGATGGKSVKFDSHVLQYEPSPASSSSSSGGDGDTSGTAAAAAAAAVAASAGDDVVMSDRTSGVPRAQSGAPSPAAATAGNGTPAAAGGRLPTDSDGFAVPMPRWKTPRGASSAASAGSAASGGNSAAPAASVAGKRRRPRSSSNASASATTATTPVAGDVSSRDASALSPAGAPLTVARASTGRRSAAAGGGSAGSSGGRQLLDRTLSPLQLSRGLLQGAEVGTTSPVRVLTPATAAAALPRITCVTTTVDLTGLVLHVTVPQPPSAVVPLGGGGSSSAAAPPAPPSSGLVSWSVYLLDESGAVACVAMLTPPGLRAALMGEGAAAMPSFAATTGAASPAAPAAGAFIPGTVVAVTDLRYTGYQPPAPGAACGNVYRLSWTDASTALSKAGPDPGLHRHVNAARTAVSSWLRNGWPVGAAQAVASLPLVCFDTTAAPLEDATTGIALRESQPRRAAASAVGAPSAAVAVRFDAGSPPGTDLAAALQRLFDDAYYESTDPTVGGPSAPFPPPLVRALSLRPPPLDDDHESSAAASPLALQPYVTAHFSATSTNAYAVDRRSSAGAPASASVSSSGRGGAPLPVRPFVVTRAYDSAVVQHTTSVAFAAAPGGAVGSDAMAVDDDAAAAAAANPLADDLLDGVDWDAADQSVAAAAAVAAAATSAAAVPPTPSLLPSPVLPPAAPSAPPSAGRPALTSVPLLTGAASRPPAKVTTVAAPPPPPAPSGPVTLTCTIECAPAAAASGDDDAVASDVSLVPSACSFVPQAMRAPVAASPSPSQDAAGGGADLNISVGSVGATGSSSGLPATPGGGTPVLSNNPALWAPSTYTLAPRSVPPSALLEVIPALRGRAARDACGHSPAERAGHGLRPVVSAALFDPSALARLSSTLAAAPTPPAGRFPLHLNVLLREAADGGAASSTSSSAAAAAPLLSSLRQAHIPAAKASALLADVISAAAAGRSGGTAGAASSSSAAMPAIANALTRLEHALLVPQVQALLDGATSSAAPAVDRPLSALELHRVATLVRQVVDPAAVSQTLPLPLRVLAVTLATAHVVDESTVAKPLRDAAYELLPPPLATRVSGAAAAGVGAPPPPPPYDPSAFTSPLGVRFRRCLTTQPPATSAAVVSDALQRYRGGGGGGGGVTPATAVSHLLHDQFEAVKASIAAEVMCGGDGGLASASVSALAAAGGGVAPKQRLPPSRAPTTADPLLHVANAIAAAAAAALQAAGGGGGAASGGGSGSSAAAAAPGAADCAVCRALFPLPSRLLLTAGQWHELTAALEALLHGRVVTVRLAPRDGGRAVKPAAGGGGDDAPSRSYYAAPPSAGGRAVDSAEAAAAAAAKRERARAYLDAVIGHSDDGFLPAGGRRQHQQQPASAAAAAPPPPPTISRWTALQVALQQ
jgi:hypothetical protein